MISDRTFTPYRPIVLASNGLASEFRTYLAYLTYDVVQAYHEIMNAVVESIRYRDKAMASIVLMVNAMDGNIHEDITVKRQIVRTVKELALELYFQAESFKLYNKEGLLMYAYVPHPEPAFEDVLLQPVIQLTYNPSVPCYEPAVY